jgi:TolB-like protein
MGALNCSKMIAISFVLIANLLTYKIIYCQDISYIAVLDLDNEAISQSEANIISDRLRIELVNTGKFNVIERNKMQEILTEQGIQLSGCTTTECAITVGMLIGVDKIVAGSVGKVGNIFTISLRLIEVETGKILKTATEDCKSSIEDVLTQSVKKAAERLAENRTYDEDFSTKDINTEEERSNLSDWEVMGLTKEQYILYLREGFSKEMWAKYQNAGFSVDELISMKNSGLPKAHWIGYKKSGLSIDEYRKKIEPSAFDKFMDVAGYIVPIGLLASLLLAVK